jgi:hypothetical protein
MVYATDGYLVIMPAAVAGLASGSRKRAFILSCQANISQPGRFAGGIRRRPCWMGRDNYAHLGKKQQNTLLACIDRGPMLVNSTTVPGIDDEPTPL